MTEICSLQTGEVRQIYHHPMEFYFGQCMIWFFSAPYVQRHQQL